MRQAQDHQEGGPPGQRGARPELGVRPARHSIPKLSPTGARTRQQRPWNNSRSTVQLGVSTTLSEIAVAVIQIETEFSGKIPAMAKPRSTFSDTIRPGGARGPRNLGLLWVIGVKGARMIHVIRSCRVSPG